MSPACAEAEASLTLMDMDLAAFLGSVAALTTISLGAMYFMTSQLGARIDDLGHRFGRLEERLDRLYDVVAEMGARITALEHRQR